MSDAPADKAGSPKLISLEQLGDRTIATVPNGEARGPDRTVETGVSRDGAGVVLRPAKMEAHASFFRRVVGLILVMIAAYVGSMDAKAWNAWGEWAGKTYTDLRGQVHGGVGALEPTDAGDKATKSDADQVEQAARKWPWLWLCLMGVPAIGALSLIPSKPFSLLVTSALVVITCYGGDVLLGIGLSWRTIVLCAVALAYVIHSVPRPPPLSALGIFGLLLVVCACLGAARGWYDWSPLANRMGAGPAALAANWGEELMWLTVLILSVVGVLCSRTKPVHFFIGVLLAMLAYHCVMSGRVEIKAFERSVEGELVTAAYDASTGGQITEQDDSFSNVEAWRWVMAIELVLIVAVLLRKAMGMGSLNVAFALAWMFLGCSLYDSMRTVSLARLWADLGSASGVMSGSRPGTGHSSSLEPLANWGLPTAQPPGQSRAGSPQSIREASKPGMGNSTGQLTPDNLRTANCSTLPATHLPRQTPIASGTDRELATARAAALATVKQVTWRELALPLWMFLTAILAGIIAITGLRILLDGEGCRAWLSYALWLVFGIGLTALWFADPKEPQQSWMGWVSDWTQSRFKLHVVWLIFAGTLAVTGSWALRSRGHVESWIHASIGCAFLGTALTLIGVAILIYFGGFAPLPVWMYGAIAAGQSSLAWILMMHLSIQRSSRVQEMCPSAESTQW